MVTEWHADEIWKWLSECNSWFRYATVLVFYVCGGDLIIYSQGAYCNCFSSSHLDKGQLTNEEVVNLGQTDISVADIAPIVKQLLQ